MQAHILPDGRLHLHHGPIDLLLGAQGKGRLHAYEQARECFDGLLQGLVDELAELRTALHLSPQVTGPVAREMLRAIQPFHGQFVTPMAAVAGAVADRVLIAMQGADISKCYVNNGGDIAVHLTQNQQFTAAIPDAYEGRLVLKHTDPWRGIATSGWLGRSLSLGIADNVTVVAKTAAMADVSATMIANSVDLAGHRAVTRELADDDSDLTGHLVTIDVGCLSAEDKVKALAKGHAYAANLLNKGLIGGALIALQGEMEIIGGTEFRLATGAENAQV